MKKSTLNRMLQLADIKPVIKESKMSLSNFELVKNSADGNTYAIVRENKRYHIKQAQTKENLVESDFNYVGGVANKMKRSFTSFSEATRNLNLMFEEINNHHENESTDILESDEVLSEKKFVLKLDKKKKTKSAPPAEEPMEEPAAEEGGEEEFDFGGEEETEGEEDFDFGGEEEETEGEEDFDFGGEEEETEEGGEEEETEEGGEEFDFGDEEGGEEEADVEEFGGEEDEDLELDDSDDEIKDIQSTTGKLGQQLRDVEDITSDMQKWVAKSVLSALDLENMDSEDKKDIIKTVKKKSDEPAEEEVESSEEEFDFGGEEEMEESYDNYMGYDDDMDGMNEIDWENGMSEYGVSEYDSNMSEKSMEEVNDFLNDMEEAGIIEPEYDSHMSDDPNIALALDNPNPKLIEAEEEDEDKYEDPDVAEPDDEDVEDKLLLDVDMDFPSYEDVYLKSSDEMDALYGPNNKKYDRSDSSKARRQADKDISRHYNKPAAPGYDLDPTEKWAKHKLPYDTEFIGEGDYMTEDHLNDQMDTYEQEKAYEDVEKVVRRYGMDVELREKATSEDPEETLIYLDIVDGDKKLLVARINSVGDIEVGEMRGNKFSGEPLDSVDDFIEIFDEDLTNKEKQELDMDITMSPQPQRAPETEPSQPDTKPGRPEKAPPTERPSRRPFTPPPTITPGEEPGPKAADDDVEFE